jgi:pyruvate ferredoxin oxidoreductase gamma subunit
VIEPDALIIQDPTLLGGHDVLVGLAAAGFVLVNSTRTWTDLGMTDLVERLPAGHAVLVPASSLALAHVGRALPNAALVGGFAALCGLMSLGSVIAAIEARFPASVAEANVRAARAAFGCVRCATEQAAHA